MDRTVRTATPWTGLRLPLLGFAPVQLGGLQLHPRRLLLAPGAALPPVGHGSGAVGPETLACDCRD